MLRCHGTPGSSGGTGSDRRQCLPLLARLDTHFEQLSDIVRLARHCRLEALIDQIEDRMKKALTFGKPRRRRRRRRSAFRGRFTRIA